MSYHSRNYRHRNPKAGGEEQKASAPFFAAPKGAAQRKKKGDTFFQAKLTIGQPGDVHEKEADAVASQVVRRQADQKPVIQRKDGRLLQRLATSKEDEKLGTHDARMEKDKEEPEKPVYTKQMPGEKKDKDKMGIRKAEDPKKKKKKGPGMGGVVRKKEANMASGAVSAEIERQSGKGSPLPAKTLAEMNRSFGMDFGKVRIHHDDAAARLCCELNAQAFTHGLDIYFNEGKYNPESAEGKMLLAHELTHVAQQSGHSGSQKP
jgi:hypothetical protein